MRLRHFLSTLAVLLLASPAAAQDVDEILSRAVSAFGGKVALRELRTLRTSGKVSFGGEPMPFLSELKRPNRMRTEIAFKAGLSISGFDGTVAWEIDPNRPGNGAVRMSGEQSSQVAEDSEFEEGWVNWAEKGNHVELVGSSQIGDHRAWRVKLVRKSGHITNEYFDAETYLRVKTEATRPINGKVLPWVLVYSDFRKVGGLQFPFRVDGSIPGADIKQAMAIEKYEPNASIDDARFIIPPPQR
jgi:hypothetical protein